MNLVDWPEDYPPIRPWQAPEAWHALRQRRQRRRERRRLAGLGALSPERVRRLGGRTDR